MMISINLHSQHLNLQQCLLRPASAKSRRRCNPFGLWLRFHHGFSSCITNVSTFFGSLWSFLFSVPLSMPHLQHHSLLHQVGWRIPSGWYQACQCLVEPTRQCPWLEMVHDIMVQTYSLPFLLIYMWMWRHITPNNTCFRPKDTFLPQVPLVPTVLAQQPAIRHLHQLGIRKNVNG